MSIPNFTNKIVPVENQIIPTPISTPISQRISPNLFNQFSNLNFAGVYRIGSESIRDECYIGSAYNMTYKITHHLNLLYRNEHHSKGLQDWVNINGIEALDISVIAWSKPHPSIFEKKEQYFLNLIKPKFNTILNKREIKVEWIDGQYTGVWANKRVFNEFNHAIVGQYATNTKRKILKITDLTEIDEERKTWKPTQIIVNGNEIIRIRGDVTNFKVKPKIVVTETVVVRKGVFNTR